MRGLCTMICGVGLAGLAYGEEPRPLVAGPELPVEAGKLIEGLPTLVEPSALPEPQELAAGLNVEQAEKRLAQARQKHLRWQKLAKQGVISAVELETCEVEVVMAELTVRKARLAEARATAPENVESCERQCTEAQKTVAELRLALARRNLDRYRRLYAARLISKVDVQRAEALVKRLEVPQAP